MDSDDLKELARMAFNCAKSIIEGGQDAAPMFLLTDPNAIIPVAFTNNAEKDYVFGRMRRIIAEIGASAYVFVTEAWTLKLKSAQAYYDGVLPSQSPDRIDTLQVDAWTRGGDHVILHAEIKTTPEGRTVTEPEIETTMQTIGRAANLFEASEYQSIN